MMESERSASTPLRSEFAAKSKRELLNIWHTPYRHEWTDEEFALVGQVLVERGVIAAADARASDGVPAGRHARLVDQVAEALVKIEAEETTRWKQFAFFGASLLAFLAAAWLIARSDQIVLLRLVILLPGVLLLHEAGHYLLMRRFGYRNLRMFSIPLFGAAVEGRGAASLAHSSLVALAGPLPGFLLGCLSGAWSGCSRAPSWPARSPGSSCSSTG